jgi:CheY-like chemotaxis protein
LAAREAERVGAIDAELDAARAAVEVAEAARARAEERATSVDAALQAVKGMLEQVHLDLTGAREEIVALREAERGAVAEVEQQRTSITEAQTREAETRVRLEIAERRLAELSAEHERRADEARGHQGALAHAEARVETVAAERDQLREALARSEAECTRLHDALGAAQTQDARVEGELAREREEQTLLTVRLAETEAAVARLEAITASQQTELVERDAEILRLTAELADRECQLAEQGKSLATMPVEAPEVEVMPVVSPETPEPVATAEADVTVVAVRTTESEPEFVPTGAPVVVVLDGDGTWSRIGVPDHDVAVIRPGTNSVSRIMELNPVRVVANLATPGALTAMLAMRAGGSQTRFLGCVADASRDRAIALSVVEPVVGPIDPDAIMGALGQYAGRDGRIVTTGTDVDALMSLRQALSRRKASVSMAWDAKQAREMLGVVKPHAVVVDMNMPKRDGCAILAAVSALDPVPLAVLVVGSGDPAQDFASLVSEPPHGLAFGKAASVLATLATFDDEALPQVKVKPAQQRARAAQNTRWLG